MLYHLAGGAWQAGQRGCLLCPLLLLGALGVTRWLETTSGARRRDLAWGGLALGASMTIKPHTVALAAALGVMIAVTAWRTGSGVFGPLACFLAGAAVAPLAVALWLALAGALPAWRAIVFDYLVPLYRGSAERLTSSRVSGFRSPAVSCLSRARCRGTVPRASRRRRRRRAVWRRAPRRARGWEYHLIRWPRSRSSARRIRPALARLRRPAIPLLLSVALTLVLLTGKAMAVSRRLGARQG
jgi:hypothetical protein